MKKLLFATFVVLCLPVLICAQPRPVEKAPAPVPANAPMSYKARYEGGVFGASAKESGTLKLDDINERVIFYKKDQKEMFSIPYSALLVIYPDSKEGVSKTGNVVSRLPLPGAGLVGLITKSTKYLIVNFDDPDIDAKGTANFKFDNKELLLNFINTLGPKAKMKQRGDAYYKPKNGPAF